MTIAIQSSSPTRSEFLSVMFERGFVQQCTDPAGLDSILSAGPAAGFVGFDATARSLHVGHLLSLMALRWFSRTGNRAIALMGGATTLVGDPSFRNSARPMLTAEQVGENVGAISEQVRRVLGHRPNVVIRDNADWLGKVSFIDFLRDVGTHFTVPRMLAMESVKTRLDDGLTMLEFAYMMLQSADFVELSRREGCVLQMGGSDQWGNICNGIDLSRRMGGKPLFGLTTPLLETASGQKMGKTARGAVWLDASMLDPLGFWQWWRNVEDADVPRFLRLFTEMPLDEVTRLASLGGSEINVAKKVLANSVTAIVHGESAAQTAAEQSFALYSDAGNAEVTQTVEAPEGIGALDLLVRIGFAGSKGEARRLIQGRGVRIDGVTIKDDAIRLPPTPRVDVAVGKRRKALVAIG